ncbi:MAG: hypothetical protein ACRC0L_02405, partial [Angustibacter sp.]
MVGLFIRLKLRIYRNILRGSPASVVGLIVSLILGLQVAILGFAGLAGLRVADDLPVTRWEIAACIFGVVSLVWTIGPVALSGYDDTLRTDVLLLFPLRTRDILLGQFGSGLVGIAALSTTVALTGAIIGLTTDIWSILLAPLIIACYLAFNIVLTRSVGTALTGLLRSRRGREIAIGLVITAASVGYVGVLSAGPISAGVVRAAAGVFAWTPPGWAVAALRAFAAGAPARGLGWLLALCLCTGALLCWWNYRLDRLVTSADSSTPPDRRSPHSAARATPRAARFLATHRSWAIAAWCGRYSWRTPSRRIALSTGLLGGLVVPVIVLSGVPSPSPGWVYLSFLGGWLMATSAANQFGYDGAARWQLLASGVDLDTDLRG